MKTIGEMLSMANAPAISVTMSADDFEELIKQTVRKTVESLKEVSENEVVWLTPKQVSERLRKNAATLWRWNKEGYLKGYKFGKRVRYKLSDVERIEKAEIDDNMG